MTDPALAQQPAYWPQATAELTRRDPVMAGLISRYPGFTLQSNPDAFMTLARAIVGQQISTRAADTVWQRLLAAVQPLRPDTVLLQPIEILRGAGLSGRKADYLRDLADHFVSGKIAPRHWEQENDATLIAELTAVHGIGRWTAEMFLIFHLARADILPLDDLGLVRAIELHYHAGEKLPRRDIVRLAENWAPWRTVATWYLWRSLDPEPIQY